MNRQQRRAAPKQSRQLTRGDAWRAINTMITKHSVAPQDTVASTQLLVTAYEALTALVGTESSAPWLDTDGFIRLNEMNAFGFCLAKRLHDYGTERTKEAVKPSQVVFERAADALVSIGQQFNAKNVYRSTDDELTALRESLQWIDELIQLSTQGHTLSALIEAKGMCNGTKTF